MFFFFFLKKKLFYFESLRMYLVCFFVEVQGCPVKLCFYGFFVVDLLG